MVPPGDPVSNSSTTTRLGRYEVIELIAAGGMAEVFLARSVGAMGFQRLVALKRIHTNFTRDPEFVKMFIDEARIAMHLHHRNIVQVFDLDEDGGTYFLAMEYIRGTNLYGLYERMAAANRWFEAPLAMYIVAQVCKGLHFAHTRSGPDGRPMGIVHRDISPQNVLLSFEGEVKITDFGIATAAERLHQTAAGIVKGKYAYMAPERLDDQPSDARVDVFSAGVLLYELLTGENPFAGTNAVETIERVLAGNVPPPSARGAAVPDRLDEICMKALAQRPADRYPTALAFAEALTQLAMELTYTRAEMASGDAAVADLLAELFPAELGRSIPSQPARPEPQVTPPVTPTGPAANMAYVDAPTLLRPNPTDELQADTDEGAATVAHLDDPAEDHAPDATVRSMPAVSRPAPIEDADAATLPLGYKLDVDLDTSPTPPSPLASAPVPLVLTPNPLVGHDPANRPSRPMSVATELGEPRPGRRLLLPIIVMLGVIGLGVAAWLLLGSQSSPVVEVPVRFESIPAGAEVRVNGQLLQYRTPTSSNLRPGTHAVSFRVKGYAERTRTIEVDSRQSETVSVELSKMP